MYGLGGVPFSATETRKEGEKIGSAIGEAIEGVLRKHGKKADDVEGKVALLWATAHGLVALTMVDRIPGGQQEALRLAEQATRDYITSWRGG
jgi:hypothetical protein